MVKKKQSVWEKAGPRKAVEKKLPQVPGTRKSLARDEARRARPAGLRRSKNGNLYWETRENRSDKRVVKNSGKVVYI